MQPTSKPCNIDSHPYSYPYHFTSLHILHMLSIVTSIVLTSDSDLIYFTSRLSRIPMSVLLSLYLLDCILYSSDCM